jgi:fermentation-respiration switch protein FrsA (DUF1100 family)
VGEARTAEALGEPPRLEQIVPNTTDGITKDTPTLCAEGTDYYRTPRAQCATAPNWYLFRSVDRIAAYSSYDRVDLISPHPFLMIADTKAHTLYFSEQACGKAKEPKELFPIKGATHIDLYDKEEYVGPAVEKLDSFLQETSGRLWPIGEESYPRQTGSGY